MWYRFYIEPYFDKGDIKRLKEAIVSYLTKDGADKDKTSGVEKQFKSQQIQEEYFKVILPFMLSERKKKACT